MDMQTVISGFIGGSVLLGFGAFLWYKVKQSKKQDVSGEGGVEPPDPLDPLAEKSKTFANVTDFIGKLFNNPRSIRWIIVGALAIFIALLSVKSRGEELYFDAGSAVVRGYAPTLGLNIAWKEAGPVNTDYELGFKLIGQSEYRDVHQSNQFVIHGMLVDGYKNFEMGMGFAYFNVPSDYACQETFTILTRWRFTPRIHAQYQHYSSGGSCKPNVGRDLFTLGWRF